MLPLPDGYASESKDLMDDRFCILMLLGARFRLHSDRFSHPRRRFFGVCT